MRRTLSLLLLFLPSPAFAHAFGQQYSLPLPVTFYITGGLAALVASFAIFALFSAPASGTTQNVQKVVTPWGWPFFVMSMQGVSLVIFVLSLLVGFFGSASYVTNPVPIFFWVIMLLGLTYLTVFLDGIWDIVNPFRLLLAPLQRKLRKGLFAYPEGVGYWPALFFYLILVWVELNSGGLGAHPRYLASSLFGYLLIGALGSFLFGFANWFERIDFFTVFFRFIGKFAPVSLGGQSITLRYPGTRLIFEQLPLISALFFVLFMLSSTAFDGFKETKMWLQVFLALHDNGYTSLTALNTFALMLSPFLFFTFYAFTVWLMSLISRTSLSYKDLLLRFGTSLIPIAIVYSFAHYFMLLYTQAPHVLSQLSDPFGVGVKLYGASDYAQNLPVFLPADTVWYIQLTAIVVGHIVATYIAHCIAVRTFESKRAILLSQIPMLLLMLLYTTFGLWLLSLPFAA